MGALRSESRVGHTSQGRLLGRVGEEDVALKEDGGEHSLGCWVVGQDLGGWGREIGLTEVA